MSRDCRAVAVLSLDVVCPRVVFLEWGRLVWKSSLCAGAGKAEDDQMGADAGAMRVLACQSQSGPRSPQAALVVRT